MSPAATALMGLDVGDPTHEAKLNALTVPELKAVCTHFGLVSTGVKATLVSRIRNHKMAAGGGGGGGGGGGAGGGGAGGGGGGGGGAVVVLPATPGDLVAMSDADLRLVCAQAGIDGAGAMVDVQSRLHVHLFGAPGTPTEAVQTACDVEFAAVLLSATGSSDDVAEHSAAGAWLASSLRYLLRKQVTVKTFLHRKVTFQRAGQAHNDVVFAQDMKPGDPGLVQFVEAWVTQLIAVMPLPALMTIEDAEGSLLEVLKALCTAKVNPAGAPPPPAPVDWLVEFQRAAAAGKPVDDSAFNNADLSKAIAVLRSYGFFVDKSGVPRLSQLMLIMKAMSAKEAGRSTPGLCVDPRVQPLSLRAMLDANGNFAPDQAKMVQLADGTWVESSTPEPVSTKVHTALEVVRAHIMYWTAHLVVGTRLTDLHSRYDGRTTDGAWCHPYFLAKFQALMWRVVERVTGDTLDGILTPLLQHVQERTNSADDDAWTGETALEFVCTKVTEQVSFAAAFGGKRKADAPGAQQGTKAQKSPQMFMCTVCEVRKTNHASKICLSCATAAKKAPAAAAPAAAVAPAAAAVAPVAGP